MSSTTEHDVPAGAPHALHNGARSRTVGEIVRIAICTDVARLVANDAMTRLGEDAEGVHQARVATRRLRSQLATFQPVLRRRPTTAVRRELRWLGRHLGVLRDLDVLHERLTDELRAFEPLEREDAFEVLRALDEERSAQLGALRGVLRSTRYRTLLGSLGDLVAAPPFRRSAGLPAAPLLTDVLYGRFIGLADKVAGLPALPSDVELHEVRIEAKPLRYAASAASKVLGPTCGRLARRTTELCDELGRLNDGARATAWLDATVSQHQSPSVVRLRSAEVVKMAEARAAWRERWDRVVDAARDLSWPLAGDVEG